MCDTGADTNYKDTITEETVVYGWCLPSHTTLKTGWKNGHGTKSHRDRGKSES